MDSLSRKPRINSALALNSPPVAIAAGCTFRQLPEATDCSDRTYRDGYSPSAFKTPLIMYLDGSGCDFCPAVIRFRTKQMTLCSRRRIKLLRVRSDAGLGLSMKSDCGFNRAILFPCLLR